MSWRAGLEAWFNRRWYGPRPIAALLPLAWLYGSVVALRSWLYRRGFRARYRSPLPVIVVGNLTVGGAGKTPLVLALIEALRARGWEPGVISRGHGAALAGAVLLPEAPSAVAHGDEPSLIRLRAQVPVAIARRRAEAARLLEAQGEVDLLIADDGLQHYALDRDLELLVIDGRRGFGNGALLPAGPLREPVARGRRCDFRIRNGGVADEGEWPLVLRPSVLRSLASDAPETPLEPADLAGQRVHAVAGIGDPARFFATLRALGMVPVEHAFPDHHAYVAADLQFAEVLPVVMTEKDAVKCAGFAPPRSYALRVDAQLPALLFDAIDARLRALPRTPPA